MATTSPCWCREERGRKYDGKGMGMTTSHWHWRFSPERHSMPCHHAPLSSPLTIPIQHHHHFKALKHHKDHLSFPSSPSIFWKLSLAFLFFVRRAFLPRYVIPFIGVFFPVSFSFRYEPSRCSASFLVHPTKMGVDEEPKPKVLPNQNSLR